MNWKLTLMTGLVAMTMVAGCQPVTREELISNGGTMPTPATHEITSVGDAGEATESYQKDGEPKSEWKCTTQKFSAAEAPEDIVTFEPNPATIWPGSLLQGGTLESGAPEPIAVKRGGGTVLMNLVNAGANGAKSYQVKLDEMTQGNVIDAQNTNLANNTGGTPAAFTFESVKVDSQEELALAMNARAEWMSGSVEAKMKFQTDQRYTRYLIKLSQRYYTMVYQTPTSLDEVFAPSVTPEQLAPYVFAGNPATYISSVTYGRQFYMLLESTASKQEVEAALKLTYSGLVVDATVEMQANYKKVQEQSTLHVLALGGSAENALGASLAASASKFDDLHRLLVSGATFGAENPGVPISYTVRNVSDNKLVKVGVATEFVRKSCLPVVRSDNRVALHLDATSLPASATPVGIDRWTGLTTVQNDGIGHGVLTPNAINGHPAMWMDFSMPGFDVDLGSGKAVGTDYTVIAVLRNAGPEFRDACAGLNGHACDFSHFLRGQTWDWGLGGGAVDGNLHLGFEKSGVLRQGHWADDLTVQARPSDRGDLLTFEFSQAAGKAIHQNGVFRGAAPDEHNALTGFIGAKIGGTFFSNNFLNYQIVPYIGFVGEVRVYSYRLTDAARRVVECELGKKWDIGTADCVDGKPDPSIAQY